MLPTYIWNAFLSIPLSFFLSSFITHEMELGLMLFFILTLALFLFPTSFYFPLFLACNERWTFLFLEKILWCYGMLLSLASPFKSPYGFFGGEHCWKKIMTHGYLGWVEFSQVAKGVFILKNRSLCIGFCSPARAKVMDYCLQTVPLTGAQWVSWRRLRGIDLFLQSRTVWSLIETTMECPQSTWQGPG